MKRLTQRRRVIQERSNGTVTRECRTTRYALPTAQIRFFSALAAPLRELVAGYWQFIPTTTMICCRLRTVNDELPLQFGFSDVTVTV